MCRSTVFSGNHIGKFTKQPHFLKHQSSSHHIVSNIFYISDSILGKLYDKVGHLVESLDLETYRIMASRFLDGNFHLDKRFQVNGSNHYLLMSNYLIKR